MWKLTCRRRGSERGAFSLKHPASVPGWVGSLYFTTEVTGSLKSDFSAANLCLNQYSLSNHLQEKGLAHSGELQQRDRGRTGEGGGEAIHLAAQIRVWGWNTHSEYREGGEHGSWDSDRGTATARDGWDLRAVALFCNFIVDLRFLT